jgi:NIMA (never in mitosis gene a)-related kinase
MAALRPPFEGRDMEQLFKSIQNSPTPPLPSFYSSTLTQFVSLALSKQPKERPTAAELLNHPNMQRSLTNQQQTNSSKNITTNKQLLQTIKLPSDMTQLREKLPLSKY